MVLLTSNEAITSLLTLPTHDDHRSDTKDTDDSHAGHLTGRSYRLLAVIVIAASIVLGCYAVPTTTALGTSSVIFAAAGLALFQSAIRSIDDTQDVPPQVMSVMGIQAPDMSASQSRKQQQLAVLRDIAGTLMVLCGIAACLLEIPANGTIEWTPSSAPDGLAWRPSSSLSQGLWMLPFNVILTYIMFTMVR